MLSPKLFSDNNRLNDTQPSDSSDIEMARIAAQLQDLKNDGVVLQGNAFVTQYPVSVQRTKQSVFVKKIKKTDTPSESCGQWIKRKLGCYS